MEVIASVCPKDKMADDISELSQDLKNLKKRRKKAPVNPDDTGEQLAELAAKAKITIPVSEQTEETPEAITNPSLLDDLKGKKKKKGKKKIEPLDTSTIGEDVYKVPQEQEISISDVQGEAPVKPPQKEVRLKLPEEDSSAFSELFSLPPKKKRRRQNITFEGFDIEEAVTTDGLAGEGQAEGVDDELEDLKQKMPWLVSDRDYSYEELLERAFKLITRNNPSMTGGRQKVVMKPPQVIRVGRKTAFANFAEISKMLHREPKHLMSFLMAELGTIGSVDGNNQLIIKGVFQQKNVESVLKKYIKEYVTCHTCRSPDTILQREIRLTFLQCERCGSRCSVQNIRTGFVAVTNRVTMRMRQT